MITQTHICSALTKISKEVYKIDTNYQCYKLREGIIHIPRLWGISVKYSTAEKPHWMWKEPQLNPINVTRKTKTGNKDGLLGNE